MSGMSPVSLATINAADETGLPLATFPEVCPWTPAQVFDDGARVYIKLPEAARHAEAPVLFVLDPDGGTLLINYSLVGGDTYVTDRLFDRAVLVTGADGQEHRVLIERRQGPAEDDATRAVQPFGSH